MKAAKGRGSPSGETLRAVIEHINIIERQTHILCAAMKSKVQFKFGATTHYVYPLLLQTHSNIMFITVTMLLQACTK